MTDAPKLKPCPFCGGEASHNDGGNSVYGRYWWVVGCKNCDVTFSDKEVWSKTDHGMLDPAYPPKHCFTAWNTRAPDPDIDAHIGAVLEDWKSRIENLWITADNDREEGYDEGLQAVLEELPFVRPDAQQAIERVRREARVEFASEIVAMLTAMRGPVDVPRTERAVWVDEGIDRCIGEINDLIEAERGKT